MKKFICVIALTAALLAGCSSGNSSSVNYDSTAANNGGASSADQNEGGQQAGKPSIDQQRAQADDPNNSAIGFISQLSYFDNAEEFLSSPLAQHLESSGYKPYSIKFDENVYKITSVFGDSNFYTYSLYNKNTDTDINYTVIFGSSRKALEDLSTSDYDTIELAQNGNGNYSVLLAYASQDKPKYVTFIPAEGYEIRISSSNADKDTLIGYADDITPVQ